METMHVHVQKKKEEEERREDKENMMKDVNVRKTVRKAVWEIGK